jgi:hypothetical protein
MNVLRRIGKPGNLPSADRPLQANLDLIPERAYSSRQGKRGDEIPSKHSLGAGEHSAKETTYGFEKKRGIEKTDRFGEG